MMPEIKRSNLSIPLDVFRKARGRAIAEGSNLSAVVTALLRLWLDGKVELPQPEQKGGKHKAK